MRFTQDGTPVTNFSVAVNDSWQGRDGEQRERTEWFRIVAWRRLAEITNEYLRQGSRVYVEGRLETREWQDREGNDRTTTELIARDLLMLGGRDNEGSEQIQPENDERPVNDDEITADDLPF
jgi:single-strand DNA-binding protein